MSHVTSNWLYTALPNFRKHQQPDTGVAAICQFPDSTEGQTVRGVCETNSCHVGTCVHPRVHKGDASSANTRLYMRPSRFPFKTNNQFIPQAIRSSKRGPQQSVARTRIHFCWGHAVILCSPVAFPRLWLVQVKKELI